MNSQCKRLLEHLKQGNTITVLESYVKFGITSMHRRLTDLKERGHEIKGDWKELPSGKKVKEYRLIQ